jgi:predicted ATPase with chaperone activity
MSSETISNDKREHSGFIPAVPWTMQATGLAQSMIEHLMFNILYVRGELSGRTIADTMGLSFSVLEPILNELKLRQYLEVKRSMGYGLISSDFALSDVGRKRAREFAEINQYVGPAPVPLSQYSAAVEAQRLGRGWLTPEALTRAYRHMVINPETLDLIGPAVNSGRSFLIYGQPGNGKTYMAEALVNLESSPVFIPHAIEYNGLIIQLFDPLNHRPLEGQNESAALFCLQRPYDSRWVRCRRPFISTGGELNLSMLELSYNLSTKIYGSPCHLKANNGIYLIDDFGRQKMTPADLLNRWIVPMESRMDHLTLPTGGKLSVPFETFLIFSTNLNPQTLGDEAFLRRIQYKMFVQNPDRREFIEIFKRVCAENRFEIADELLAEFIDRRYVRSGKPFRRCHPRDVVSHAIDLIHFRGRPHELARDILDHAFISCFAETNNPGHARDIGAASRLGHPVSGLSTNCWSGGDDAMRLLETPTV